MTFSDDFHQLDFTRWATLYPWGLRWIGSEEREIYVDPAYAGSAGHPLHLNPFHLLKGGGVRIEADKVSSYMSTLLLGQQYTSGMLSSYPSFSQQYGYFEAKMRFPYGKGIWPTFWMVPTDMSWPPEIDIAELAGDQPTKLHVTVHTGTEDNDQPITTIVTVPDMSKAAHAYGFLWTPTYLAWYFDGRQIATTPTPPQLQQKPMYIILNLAVGGGMAGQPDASTRTPASMVIDYVRAYALPTN